MRYIGEVGGEVEICKGVPPFEIFIRFYFRCIWYTKMATGLAPF